MGLLQWAYETYETNVKKAGVIEEGKEPLTPLFHQIQNAQITITITTDGEFVSAAPVPKTDNKTIIPVTEESGSRTSVNCRAHPLCDQLRYMDSHNEEKYNVYVSHLRDWVKKRPHEKTKAVLAYVMGGTILEDLSKAGILSLNEEGRPSDGKIEGTEYEKSMIRWTVIPSPEGVSASCWKDITLFESYQAYYEEKIRAERETVHSAITGEEDIMVSNHPKGVLPFQPGAKLISANDGANFTYMGRLENPEQSASVGYLTSQKCHSALRWIISSEGVNMGGRVFVCWNPAGKKLPPFAFLQFKREEEEEAEGYGRQLCTTLSGRGQALEDTDDVVIAALEAATTGRLSVTYYNALKASDFLARIEQWNKSCCWIWGDRVSSPDARQIIRNAFGTEQEQGQMKLVKVDDRIMKDHAQRLLHCVIDAQPIPVDIVQALAIRASTPLAYQENNRRYVLFTACAVIRKYYNDKANREEWSMALDRENTNRSYLFGRLLAIAEKVERDTFRPDEEREPNAIRMQTVFCQRPLYAWGIIEKAINPYYARLKPGKRQWLKNLVSEITEKLPDAASPELNKPLEDVYLLGYYLQRADLFKSRKSENTKELEDAEEE